MKRLMCLFILLALVVGGCVTLDGKKRGIKKIHVGGETRVRVEASR